MDRCSERKVARRGTTVFEYIYALFSFFFFLFCREKKGKCLAFLKIEKVVEDGDRYHHTFTRIGDNDTEITRDLTRTGFNTMEYVIVSTNTKVNVSAGLISEITTDSITVVLERFVGVFRGDQIPKIQSTSSCES